MTGPATVIAKHDGLLVLLPGLQDHCWEQLHHCRFELLTKDALKWNRFNVCWFLVCSAPLLEANLDHIDRLGSGAVLRFGRHGPQ